MEIFTIPSTIELPRFRLNMDLCAYCGISVATQREDPIPRCLYSYMDRAKVQLLKIPACSSCNGQKAQLDGNLRDYLVMNRRTSHKPGTRELFNGAFLRAVSRGLVPLLNRYKNGHEVDFVTDSNFWIGSGYKFPIDADLVYQALTWMVRGLHWSVFKVPVAHEAVGVSFVQDQELPLYVNSLGRPPFDGVYHQGVQFSCAWLVYPDSSVFWALRFFGGEIVTAVSAANTLGQLNLNE